MSLFVTTELPTTQSKVYDPEVSQGKILVAVEDAADVNAVESTLRATHVDEIKKQ